MQELLSLQKYHKGLIIHHWDTDGLCSAALMYNFLHKLKNEWQIDLRMPKITNYFLIEQEYQDIKEQQYDFIITVDINFKADTINALSKICNNVLVFDHHHKELLPPNIFYYNKSYPGCTYVINEYLQEPISLLGIMGMVGDKEERIKLDEQFYPKVEQAIQESNLAFNDLIKIRNHLDSMYILEQYNEINNIIKNIAIDLKVVINNQLLINNVNIINQEINKYASLPINWQKNILGEIKIDSHYNIISQTTRNLAKKYQDKLIFTWQEKQDNVIIYVRRTELNIDLEEIVDFGREQKLSCGGKHEVVGLICPNNKWLNFRTALINKLLTYAK